MQLSSTPRSRSSLAAGAALVATLVVMLGRPLPATAAEPYAVIVSKGVPVEDLSMDELRRVLTFKRTQWKSGQPITLLLPGGTLPARRFLLSRIYRLSDEELRRFILQSIFQAEIDFAPKVVSAERDAVAFVASGSSVIAVVSASTPGLDKVRVLRIDKRLPGESGYPLQ